jgi:hypothetical protein
MLKDFKKVFQNNNLEYKRNRSGELINGGHRRGDKYYHVYLKSEVLRFEFEYKHRKTLIYLLSLRKAINELRIDL